MDSYGLLNTCIEIGQVSNLAPFGVWAGEGRIVKFSLQLPERIRMGEQIVCQVQEASIEYSALNRQSIFGAA